MFLFLGVIGWKIIKNFKGKRNRIIRKSTIFGIYQIKRENWIRLQGEKSRTWKNKVFNKFIINNNKILREQIFLRL